MMIVIAVPGLDGVDMRVLAGLQHHKKLAFPVGDGKKFAQTKIDFVYITGPRLICTHHSDQGLPAVLRKIADDDIGQNAPHIADELNDLADRLEKEMRRER